MARRRRHQRGPEIVRQLVLELAESSRRNRQLNDFQDAASVKRRLLHIGVLAARDAIVEIAQRQVLEQNAAGTERTGNLGRELRRHVLGHLRLDALMQDLEGGPDDRLGVAARRKLCEMLDLSDEFIVIHATSRSTPAGAGHSA
jgi:hypothetical protein